MKKFPRFAAIFLTALLLTAVLSFSVGDFSVKAAESSNLLIIDLVEEAPSALWKTGGPSGTKTITFGGPDNDPDGFAMYKENVKLNDGKTYDRVLETHPR